MVATREGERATKGTKAMKRKASDAQLIRRMARELQHYRREEASLARCLRRFEGTPAWTPTFAETAKVLGCTEQEVRRLVREVTIWGPTLQRISARRIPRSELRRYLEEQGVRLRDAFVYGIEQTVFPGFNSVRWRMKHHPLSAEQAAKKLEVSHPRVRALINDGPLCAGRSFGGHFEITPFEVEEFQKAHGELLSAAGVQRH